MVEAGREGPRIEQFAASRLLVQPGDAVEIAWQVQNAEEVSLSANGLPLDIGGRTEGSISHVVEEQTLFRLEAEDTVRQIRVDVRILDDSAVILSFVPDPIEIEAGESTRLAWVTRNASEVQIFDGEEAELPLGGASADQGSIEVSPTRNTIYRLVATGPNGAVERSATVKVRGQPLVTSSLSTSSIAAGESITLSWAVQDALRVIVSEVGGEILVDTELSMEGSIDVQPKRTTRYAIRAIGAWRDTVKEVGVEVAPRIDLFELVEAGPLGLGSLVSLRWETAGATTLILSNGAGEEQTIAGYRVDEGSARLTVGEGGSFRLRALGGDGQEVEKTVSAAVLGLPSIASFTVSPELQSAQARPVTATVSWSGIENAERVKLETDTLGRVGIFEAPFADGELPLYLTETTNFVLTVSNSAGEVSLEATAEVVPLPTIKDFTVFPAHAAVGESVTLSWEVEDAESVALTWNGQPLPIGPSELNGTHVVTAQEVGSFLLVATNSARGDTEQGRALTIGAPEIRTFSLPKQVFQLGEPMEFSWTNRGGTELTLLLDGVPVCHASSADEIEQGGCIAIIPTAMRADFVLRLVNGLGDTVERSLEPVVTDGPVILTFTESEPMICVGDQVQLSWTVADDAMGRPPLLELVDSLGNTYDLSEKNPNQGSILVPYLEQGTHQYTLMASTEGTFSDQLSASVENVDQTFITSVVVDPPTVSPGQDVTITWDTVCADEVYIPFGSITPYEVMDAPFTDIFNVGTFIPMTSMCGTIFDPYDEGCLIFNFPGGFTFPFGGEDRSAIKLYANGFGSFDFAREGNSYTIAAFPAANYAFVNLAVYWRDLFLDPSEVGFWHMFTTDSSGKEGLLIQWGLTDIGNHFQMVLWENGTFDYRYGPMPNESSIVVAGYQDTTATEWAAIGNRATVPGGLTNRSWRFGYEPHPPSGSCTIQPSSSTEIVLEAKGMSETSALVEIVVE